MSICKKLDELLNSNKVIKYARDKRSSLSKEEMENIFGGNFTESFFTNPELLEKFILFEEKKILYWTKLSIQASSYILHTHNASFYQKVDEKTISHMKERYQEVKKELEALEKGLNHPSLRIKKIFSS